MTLGRKRWRASAPGPNAPNRLFLKRQLTPLPIRDRDRDIPCRDHFVGVNDQASTSW